MLGHKISRDVFAAPPMRWGVKKRHVLKAQTLQQIVLNATDETCVYRPRDYDILKRHVYRSLLAVRTGRSSVLFIIYYLFPSGHWCLLVWSSYRRRRAVGHHVTTFLASLTHATSSMRGGLRFLNAHTSSFLCICIVSNGHGQSYCRGCSETIVQRGQAAGEFFDGEYARRSVPSCL